MPYPSLDIELMTSGIISMGSQKSGEIVNGKIMEGFPLLAKAYRMLDLTEDVEKTRT